MIITPEVRLAARKTLKNNGILTAYRAAKAFETQERNVSRKALAPEQQLARLNARLGKGKGAQKERSRLWEQMITLGYEGEKLYKWFSSVPQPRDRYSIAL